MKTVFYKEYSTNQIQDILRGVEQALWNLYTQNPNEEDGPIVVRIDLKKPICIHCGSPKELYKDWYGYRCETCVSQD